MAHQKTTKKIRNGLRKLFKIDRIGMLGILLILTVGAIAGTDLLSNDARQPSDYAKSLLMRLNPFSGSPEVGNLELNREYIYAGSQLLAIEDAGAKGAPLIELAIWNPITGEWKVKGGNGTKSISRIWGVSGDLPTHGDYDGDGKTDFSIFRPESNQWWIIKSADGDSYSVDFGTRNDLIVPADYDGDGKTDIAVFRPSNSTWYILRSSDRNVTTQQFGLETDIPSPSDYDGDGKVDIGVWRDSTKTFYSLNTSDSAVSAVAFSYNSTQPVAADYDGDAKSDYAIRSGANWYIRTSSDGVMQPAISWGNAGDIGVPHDFDGDGKADVAVWRISDGSWRIQNSLDSSTTNTVWGAIGGKPVPAKYGR